MPWNFGFLSIPCSLTAPFKKKNSLQATVMSKSMGKTRRQTKLYSLHSKSFFCLTSSSFDQKFPLFFNTFKTLISYVSARTYLSSVCLGHNRMVFMYGSENVYTLMDSLTIDRKPLWNRARKMFISLSFSFCLSRKHG